MHLFWTCHGSMARWPYALWCYTCHAAHKDSRQQFWQQQHRPEFRSAWQYHHRLDLPWVDGQVAVCAVVLHAVSCVEIFCAMGTHQVGEDPRQQDRALATSKAQRSFSYKAAPL
jgi:hypothetical protein